MLLRTTFALLLVSASAWSQSNRAWQYVGTPGFSSWATICNRIAVDSNGVAYVAYQDLLPGLSARVTVKKLVGDTWQYVGQPGTASTGSGYYCNMGFDAQNNLFIACRDYGLQGSAGVRRFDVTSNTWVPVGAGISPGEAHWVDLAISPDGKPCVVYADMPIGNKSSAMRYDQGSWSPLGTAGFSPATAGYQNIAIAPNGTIYAAYNDGVVPDPTGVGRATVRKFDATSGTWEYVGLVGFSPDGANNLTLTIDRVGTPWVAYYRYHSSIEVWRFDGVNWVHAPGTPNGTDLPTVESEPWRQWLSLQFDSENRPYVAYELFDHARRAAVRRLEGNTWVPVGELGFTPDGADYLSMVIDAQDTPWVAFRDLAYGQRMSVMRYAPVSEAYCSSMQNSLGCTATITSSGAPSLTGATPFSIRASNVVSNTTGVLVWGAQAVTIPFGGGTLCVGSLHRLAVSNSGGAGGSPNCTGVLQRDFGTDLTSGLPGVWFGTSLFAQFWYRDVNAPGGFALSNGLRFVVGP